MAAQDLQTKHFKLEIMDCLQVAEQAVPRLPICCSARAFRWLTLAAPFLDRRKAFNPADFGTIRKIKPAIAIYKLVMASYLANDLV